MLRVYVYMSPSHAHHQSAYISTPLSVEFFKPTPLPERRNRRNFFSAGYEY